MARLDTDKQNKLEPERVRYAKEQLEKLGIAIIFECDNRIDFMFKESKVELYPYSGWHTGKTIQDGRGIHHLLKQLKAK